MLNRERYRFKADLYGTSWYHSHYSAQYAGGLLGPMIIYGPSNYDYDIDLGPVFLSDCRSLAWVIVPFVNWRTDYHKDYFEIVKEGRYFQSQDGYYSRCTDC